MTFKARKYGNEKNTQMTVLFYHIVQPLPHKGKKVKVTPQHAMQAQPGSVAELHLHSFFNPGAR
jgi:hypothetical protein